MASISDYTQLVTSEHQKSPKFMAMVAVDVQPYVDLQNLLASIPSLYDLDNAVGSQLDVVGQWVGILRTLTEPLTGVYFALDTAGVGLDQGYLQGPYDPTTGVVELSDGAYRTLLRAVIAANHWDGTVPGAYKAWMTVFSAQGYALLIQDNQDMTMVMAVLGAIPDAAMQAFLSGGLMDMRPAGVSVSHMIPGVANTPYFGLDAQNSSIAGLDSGALGVVI